MTNSTKPHSGPAWLSWKLEIGAADAMMKVLSFSNSGAFRIGSAVVPARLHGSIAISCIALLCLAASRPGYADPNEEQSGSNHVARSDRPNQP